MRRRALAAVLAVPLAAIAGAIGWIGFTGAGLEFMVAQLHSRAGGALRIEGARGALAREVAIDRLAWTSGGTRLEARELRARLDPLALLYATVRLPSLQAGSVRLEAGDDGRPPPQAIGLPLRLRAPDVRIGRFEAAGRALTGVSFHYAGGAAGHALRGLKAATPWGDAALEVTLAAAAPFALDLEGSLARPEGTVRAKARVHPFAAQRIVSLEAAVEGVDLRRIAEAAPRTEIALRVQGASAGDALLAGKLTVLNASPGPLDGGLLPFESAESPFRLREGVLALENFSAQAAGGTVRGSGSLRAGLARFSVQAFNLDLRTVRSSLRATRLGGTLELSLGEREQAVRGTLVESGLRLTADAVRRGNEVQVKRFRAQAEGGEVSGSGRVLLGTPPRAEGSVRFSRFDPSRFGDYPRGSINGEAVLSGGLDGARRVKAGWTIAQSTLLGQRFASRGQGVLAGERLLEFEASAQLGAVSASARGSFAGPGDELAWTLRAAELPLQGWKGELRASGRAGGTWREPSVSFTAGVAPAQWRGLRAERLEARGAGTLAAHELSLAASGGDFHVEARARGGWRTGAGWQGRLLALKNDGRYPAVLQAPFELAIAPGAVRAEPFRLALGTGHLQVTRLDWQPGRLASSGSFSRLPAAWALASAGLAGRLRTDLLLEGAWNLASSPALDGVLTLKRVSGDVALAGHPAIELGVQAAALEARFEQGRVQASASLASRYGELAANGRADGLSADSALELQAQLRVADVRTLAAAFDAVPATVRLGGRAVAMLEARGTLGAPALAGTVLAEGLSLQLPPYGVFLDDGRLRARLEGDRLRIEEATLRGGEGRLSASGVLPLRRGVASSVDWRAERLRLLARPGLRLVLSGSGALALEKQRVAFRGALRADEAWLERGLRRLPRLDDDIEVVGGAFAPQPVRRESIPADLDVVVQLGENFRVRESGFDGRLRGELRLAGRAGGELRANGRIEAAPDATYLAYGRKLAVDPGVLVFDGPLDNPGLQIEGWRRNQAVEAGVRITGNLQNPRVELVSEPPVPEGAKLSWLVLGRPPGDAAGADLALLQAAAGALLGRGNQVPITTRIADRLGFDELALRGSSVGSGLGSASASTGSGTASSAAPASTTRVVALGKRLSERLYLTFEQGIGAAAHNLVKIDLSLTDRFSVRAQAGTTSGLGVFYRYSWD